MLDGVSYGPFGPAEESGGLCGPEQAEKDLKMIASGGFNAVRIYDAPQDWFLDLCREHGLLVIAGIPWTDHVDFLRSGRDRRGLLRTVAAAARRLAHRPEVGALLVGNEIESTLVRWLGPGRVQAFLEDLIDAVHDAAPETLAAYANYPTTEYLQPANADFTAFNLYLEQRPAFERYLMRLHNIAGDKPLILTETGCDAKAHGESAQANMLAWQRQAAAEAGLAGNVVFSFTDDWHRGGAKVENWQFGLTRADRSPKKSWEALSGKWPDALSLLAQPAPKMSVIVCTYNGAATLKECLAGMRRLNYPDKEVIVVDDGSTDGVPQIAQQFPEVRYIRQEHAGLSVARNTGASAATGEILAYTDDDCVPEEDWLVWLAMAFRSRDVACAGGPNIPPPPQNTAQAAVIAAPGGPAHVLVSDTVAEHLPGCNLAVRRGAFEAVEGFRPKYVAAGDDVDFCWRLQDRDLKIAFHPAAMVWHYRRFSVKAFFRQQAGYGKAEALLMARHSSRFSQTGGARWHGTVYQPALLRLTRGVSRIYSGRFGKAPFQAIYGGTLSEFTWLLTSFPWWALTLSIGLNGLWFRPALWVAALMALATLTLTARHSFSLRLGGKYHTLHGRLLLWWLYLSQPLVRGWTRFLWNVRFGSEPAGPVFGTGKRTLPRLLSKGVAEMAFWTSDGRGREDLLTALQAQFTAAQMRPHPDDGWRDWDVEVQPGRMWAVRLTTVTEYHKDGGRLTRVRLASRAMPSVWMLHSTVAIALILLAVFTPLHSLWAAGLFFIWLFAFEGTHVRHVARTSQHVCAAARAAGMERRE